MDIRRAHGIGCDLDAWKGYRAGMQHEMQGALSRLIRPEQMPQLSISHVCHDKQKGVIWHVDQNEQSQGIGLCAHAPPLHGDRRANDGLTRGGVQHGAGQGGGTRRGDRPRHPQQQDEFECVCDGKEPTGHEKPPTSWNEAGGSRHLHSISASASWSTRK